MKEAEINRYYWPQTLHSSLLAVGESHHVHVESAEKYAKFWLDPILLAESHGFLSKQLKEIRELIEKHEQQIRNKWDEHVTNHRQSQN